MTKLQRLNTKDLIHNDNALLKKTIIGCLTKKGNKQRARNLFAKILNKIKNKKKPSFEIFKDAILAIKPEIQLKTIKAGGTSYKLPRLLNQRLSLSQSVHILLESANNRHEFTIEERIVNEINAILNNQSVIFKKREEMYNIALLNRPFIR
jgi:ribosomal protein S7